MAGCVDNFNDLKELGIDCDSNELDEKFGKAADHLPKLLSNVNEETLLVLYAYYKQGKEGICNIPKPSWFDFKGRSKWEAWKKLDNMPQEKAKALYIETIEKIDPEFQSGKPQEKGNWVCVSTLQGDNKSCDKDKTIVDFVKENNRTRVLEMLKKMKVTEIDKLDENGLSLLHWASDIGSAGIISDLLTYGADINLQDSEGQTALHYSASCGHEECIKLLLAKGAHADVEDNEGLVPVDVANDENIKQLFHCSV